MTKNRIGTIHLTIKKDETVQDLIQELLDEYTDMTADHISPDKKVFFRALITTDDEGNEDVKIDFFYNSIVFCNNIFNAHRLYSANEIITKLMTEPTIGKNARYVQPDLSLWLEVFDGALNDMVSKVLPKYQKLIPTFDELKSSLYYVCVELHRKGFYLSRPIVYKSFVNQLNMEVRKTKWLQDTISLQQEINDNDERAIMLEDTIEDPDATQWAEDTRKMSEAEYDEETLIRIKEICLQFMSPLRFDRMLLQIQTKTISNDTAKDLMKVRAALGVRPLRNRKKGDK